MPRRMRKVSLACASIHVEHEHLICSFHSPRYLAGIARVHARHTLKPTLMIIWISALSDACAWSKSSTAPLMEHYLMIGSLTTSRYLTHEKVMDTMFFVGVIK